jgi:hypothetical protein
MPNTLFSVAIGIVAGLLGLWIGIRLRTSQLNRQAKDARNRQFGALLAEVEYCGRLARTYGQESFLGPLYRFPNTVYETVYPSLIREVLSGADVHALTGFYSLVDQMNRGLDVIERYRAADDQPHLVQEVSRLRKKAAEMQHPELHLTMPAESAFYTGAIAAVKRHSGEK